MSFFLNSSNIWNFKEDSTNFLSIYPEFFLIFIILFFISYFVIYDYYYNYTIILLTLSVFFSIVACLFLLLLLTNNLTINYIIFQSLLINDNFSITIKIILLIFFASLILLSKNYLVAEKLFNYEYFILLFLGLLGLFLLISSYDLISLYLAIELQSLCFYLLATFKQYSNFSTEAGLKYFILGAFSSGLLLFGCSWLYGFTGLTEFYSLQILFQNITLMEDITNNILISYLFIIIGLLFKIGAAPFHMWLPDIYEGSPTIITAFFAIIPKISILALLTRLFLMFLNSNLIYLNYLLLISAFLSLFVGSLGAIYQIQLKRLFAYSSISHVGFLLFGFAILSVESLYSVFFYIVIYMVLSLTVFSLILSLRKYDNYIKLNKIKELILVLNSNKLIILIFMFVLFSIAGIPPLVGFYSKLYVFIAGFYSKYYLLILIAAVISVLSAMYYIRLIKLMLFKQYQYIIFLANFNFMYSLLISLTFLFNFYFIFFPNLIILFIHNLILNLIY